MNFVTIAVRTKIKRTKMNFFSIFNDGGSRTTSKKCLWEGLCDERWREKKFIDFWHGCLLYKQAMQSFSYLNDFSQWSALVAESFPSSCDRILPAKLGRTFFSFSLSPSLLLMLFFLCFLVRRVSTPRPAKFPAQHTFILNGNHKPCTVPTARDQIYLKNCLASFSLPLFYVTAWPDTPPRREHRQPATVAKMGDGKKSLRPYKRRCCQTRRARARSRWHWRKKGETKRSVRHPFYEPRGSGRTPKENKGVLAEKTTTKIE